MPKPVLLQRLRREQADIDNNYKDLLKLKVINEEKCIWHITFEGASDSLY